MKACEIITVYPYPIIIHVSFLQLTYLHTLCKIEKFLYSKKNLNSFVSLNIMTSLDHLFNLFSYEEAFWNASFLSALLAIEM